MMIKTQEELLEELLLEAQETRRYAQELRQSSTRVITLVDRLVNYGVEDRGRYAEDKEALVVEKTTSRIGQLPE